MPLTNGAIFAGYTILRLLGSGGMGEVYLAEHPRLPRRDALKVLPADVSADHEYRARFSREADLASTLWHPHIVGVHDRDEYKGQLWISMDYVDGLDAGRLLASRFPAGLPTDEVVRIVTSVASALDYAHKQGLLHRDVKPANVMLTHSDQDDDGRRVLLADFGIARNVDDISGLTITNVTLGTVSYSAPEQLMGLDIDGRADQYALAATAFHLLTGGPVFDHSNPAVVISRHINAEPPALSDRRAELAVVDPVMQRALAKDPTERFSSCADFAATLRSAVAQYPNDSTQGVTIGRPESASTPKVSPTAPTQLAPVAPPGGTPTAAPRQPPPRRTRAWLVGCAAAVVVIVAIAAVVLWPRESRNDPARKSADTVTTSGSSQAPRTQRRYPRSPYRQRSQQPAS
jgi:serine/threonine protein kinase